MYEPNEIINFSIPEKDLIERINKSIKSSIPKELMIHYQKYNGGKTRKRIFSLDGVGEFVFNGFFKFTGEVNSGLALAWDVCHIDPGFMPSNLFPFGDDEGGAFFCIDMEDGSVVFYDSEFFDDDENALCVLSPSLNDFISTMR